MLSKEFREYEKKGKDWIENVLMTEDPLMINSFKNNRDFNTWISSLIPDVDKICGIASALIDKDFELSNKRGYKQPYPDTIEDALLKYKIAEVKSYYDFASEMGKLSDLINERDKK